MYPGFEFYKKALLLEIPDSVTAKGTKNVLRVLVNYFIKQHHYNGYKLVGRTLSC